jgi:hypothetical protein
MPRTAIDHIVITAPSLADGVEYVRRALGVALEIGGEHPRMGTHNCLLRLGNEIFLEVIAVNPDAARPDRPRWFQLDELAPDCLPRLATWVARTSDIYAAVAAVAASPVPVGEIETMTRGQLNWLISIPADGRLPFHGIVPALIEWQTETHPASKLQDLGCSLIRLEAFHAEAEQISQMLARLGFDDAFSATPIAAGEQPWLIAHIQTPAGPRQLGAPVIHR